MATRKFSTFEYASQFDRGSADQGACIVQDVFETPHGQAIVVVAGMGLDGEKLCRTAFERVKYYLENEQDEDSDVITGNALIYTSGYLYQLQKKDPALRPGRISCLCVLFKDEKIHYSWVGGVELYLFTGKKMYALAWRDHSKGDAPGSGYLGQAAIIEPGTDEGALSPVAGDKLIMAAGELCKHLHTRETRKILKDTMPLQTQASRILRQTTDKGAGLSSIIMLGFHGISNTERKPGGLGLPLKMELRKHSKEQEMTKKNTTKKKKKPAESWETLSIRKIRLGWKAALYAAGLLLVIYLLYDLVNYGPSPIQLPATAEVAPDTLSFAAEVEEAEAEKVETPAVIPGDETYVVRRGDTWGRIYTQFGVCSWFIINHPPNTGRFGSGGTLIAGESLRIPVKYSGKPELNPHYYREFSMDVVGNRCEHAGQELKDAFERKINP